MVVVQNKSWQANYGSLLRNLFNHRIFTLSFYSWSCDDTWYFSSNKCHFSHTCSRKADVHNNASATQCKQDNIQQPAQVN